MSGKGAGAAAATAIECTRCQATERFGLPDKLCYTLIETPTRCSTRRFAGAEIRHQNAAVICGVFVFSSENVTRDSNFLFVTCAFLTVHLRSVSQMTQANIVVAKSCRARTANVLTSRLIEA